MSSEGIDLEKVVLTPKLRRLIIERLDEKVSSIIVTPEEAKKKCLLGKVISIGPDVDLVEVDDIILIGRFSGFEVPFKSGRYTNCQIINEEDIIAGAVEYKWATK